MPYTGDLSRPPIHGPYAALITHAGYYALYAVYADLSLNGEKLRRQEYADLLRERLRTIQPLLALVQPYRKSPALRLFTERRSLERFPPERVDEAWRQLRDLIERIGPPAGWTGKPAATDAEADDAPRPDSARSPESAAEPEPEPDSAPRFPKSPVDYSQEV